MLLQESVAALGLNRSQFVHREISGYRPWGSTRGIKGNQKQLCIDFISYRLLCAIWNYIRISYDCELSSAFRQNLPDISLFTVA